jgi:hypothetical protein
VDRFIRQNFDSVEQLEILVLMRLQKPRRWTASDLALEMRTSIGSATTRVNGLVQRGLVRAIAGGEVEYEYAPADDGVDQSVAMVSSVYLTRRFVVIEAIVGTPNEKIRVFADAFRLRRGDRGD